MNETEFRRKFKALGDIKNPKEGWDKYRQHIRMHARHEPADEFIKWSTIQATMFMGNVPHIPDETEVLRRGDWERWCKLIEDPGIGKPTFSEEYPHASGQYIHQCYLLDYIEKMTGLDVARIEQVVEFGAGYGSMRKIFAMADFKGHYTMFDLPEMLILQEYYLERTLTHEQLEKTHLASYELSTAHADLILGITSISEMPVPTRDEYLSRITADYYFFVSQPAFYGMSNEVFFHGLADKHEHLNWDIRKNPLPSPAHDFITGWPK